MRTDYKIGIAALVLVGLVIVVWSFIDPEPTAAPPTNNQPPPLAVNDDPGGDPPNFYDMRPNDGVSARLDGGGIIGRDRIGDTGDGSSDSAGGAPGSDEAAGLDALEGTGHPGGDGTSPTPGSDILSLFGGRDTPTYPPDPVNSTIPPRSPGSYTVKEGDSGFWTVSKNVYGDGKHWALIAAANPEADSNALRAGQILKVPPRPVPDRSTGGNSTLAAGRAGQVLTETDGKRYYYVQEGDLGFWTVSAKAYGSGKHWALIAQANPDADSGRLRKGQKLVVPALPTRFRAPTNMTPARTLGPGEKWYTVVDGDAGFWDVSKKSYGAGKYYDVIAKANPNVNSGRLRKGQKILVPPLPPSAMRRRTTRRPSVATVRGGYGDVPIFE